MSLFYFNLKDATGLVHDPEGMDLPDEATAREHAAAVAGELMRNNNPGTRSWRLEVWDSERRPCFDLLFAMVDPSIRHLPPEMQASVIDGCTKTASLQDAILELRQTLLQVKATIARSEGKPYVAAVNGVQL